MTDEPAPASTRLPRTVWLLGGVSFFADVSGEMIYPLVPIFVIGVLGASATTLGVIEGVAQAMVALLAAWAGIRSDMFRRRLPWVRWGYGLPVAGKAVLALATTWPLALVGRAVDRIGKGLRSSPRDALITEATPPALRGRAFGLERALDTAGALVGVLTAAVLLWWLAGSPRGGASAAAQGAHLDARPFRIVFGIASAAGLSALVLTLLVREPAQTSTSPSGATKTASERLGRRYWLVLAMLVVFALANSSDTFLLSRAMDVGLSPWAVVGVYALYNAVYAIASYPAGALSDRYGRWVVLGVGWAIYAGVYAGFALANARSIAPLYACYGLYAALTDGVGKALIADHAPKSRRGRALGIYNLAIGGATLVSSVIAGLAWDHAGPAMTFWIGAGAAVVALVVLAVASVVSRGARSADRGSA